ncbi:MAG TPA: hypothetical protein VG077_15340 [Verrucomicrobiae bacterium]|nr:hypothetical protein [Verrucomicrobiae bacterium]
MLETTTNLMQPFSMFGYTEATNTDLGLFSVILRNPGEQMLLPPHKPQ